MRADESVVAMVEPGSETIQWTDVSPNEIVSGLLAGSDPVAGELSDLDAVSLLGASGLEHDDKSVTVKTRIKVAIRCVFADFMHIPVRVCLDS